jgi:hypothetical protein
MHLPSSIREHIDTYEKQLDEYYSQEKTTIKELRRVLANGSANGHARLAVALAPLVNGADKTLKARDGSKTAKVLSLLRRPRGATMKDMIFATKWKPNSIRGFISGVLTKKMGLAVESKDGPDGERIYSIQA